MSELPGIPVEPGQSEPAPFVRAPAPAPPVVTPDPEPEPKPTPTASPDTPDTGALPGFDKLALLIIVLALVLLASALADFFNWLMRFVLGPFGGRVNPKQITTQPLAQALGSTLGPFASKIDPEMGTAFTQIATTTGTMSRAYVGIANRILKLAVVVANIERHAAGQVASGNALRHTVQVQGATIKQTASQTAAQAKTAAAAQSSTDAQVHALTEHITTVIEPELNRLRKQIPALQTGQATTVKRVEDHDRQLGLEAMVGTVAMSMARLGSTWTRCDTNREIGESLCANGGNGLKDLLKGVLPLLGIVEVCTLVGQLASVIDNPVVVNGLGLFSIGIEDLLKCTGATLADPLGTPRAALSPPLPWAALAPVTV